jgi:hypothetical protein
MSFDIMKIDELKKVAEGFGVDLDQAKNKVEILSILLEEGVTFDMYNKFIEAEREQTEEPEEVKELVKQKPQDLKKQNKDKILIKMERHNFNYETYGYSFSKEHPFIAMSEKDAQVIFDNEDGFRMATPKEVQEFYS